MSSHGGGGTATSSGSNKSGAARRALCEQELHELQMSLGARAQELMDTSDVGKGSGDREERDLSGVGVRSDHSRSSGCLRGQGGGRNDKESGGSGGNMSNGSLKSHDQVDNGSVDGDGDTASVDAASSSWSVGGPHAHRRKGGDEAERQILLDLLSSGASSSQGAGGTGSLPGVGAKLPTGGQGNGLQPNPVASRSGVSIRMSSSGSSTTPTSQNASGSGSGGARLPQAVQGTLTAQQQAAIDVLLASQSDDHKISMDVLQEKFDAAGLAEELKLDAMQDKLDEAGVCAARDAADLAQADKKNIGLAELLAIARTAKLTASDDRDNLLDKIAGLEARSKHRHERSIEEYAALKNAHAQEANIAEDKANAKDEIQKAEMAKMRKQLKEEAKAAKTSSNERVVLARKEKIQKEADDMHTQDLEARLAAAKREVARRDASDKAKAQGSSELERGVDFTEQHTLEQLLKVSRNDNREVNEELRVLRLQISSMQSGHKDDLDNMQVKLDIATEDSAEKDKRILGIASRTKGRLQGQPASSSRRPRAGQLDLASSFAKVPLDAIDEVMDDEISSQGDRSDYTGQISSCGGEIGNLDEVEDDESQLISLTKDTKMIDILKSELCAMRDDRLLQSDDNAVLEAEQKSRLTRLLSQLDDQRIQLTDNEDVVSRLRTDTREKDSRAELEMEALRNQLLISTAERSEDRRVQVQKIEDMNVIHGAELEKLQQQLCYMVEARRIMNIRLEDALGEMDSMQLRHDGIVQNLTKRVDISRMDNNISTAAHNVDSDVLEQLRSLEEERNLLKNSLEWKEVQWSQTHDADLDKIKILESELEKERNRVGDVERSLKETGLRLQEAHDEVAEAKRLKDSANARVAAAMAGLSTSSAPEAVQADAQSAAVAARHWTDILRCPTRAGIATIPQGPGRAAGSAPQIRDMQISCQSACWRILTSVSGVVAVMCNALTLQVKEASKKAFEKWGSSSLRQSTLADLLSKSTDNKMEEWLTERVTGLCAPNSGFRLRDFGCMEFQNRSNSCFDASMICAHLPSEIDDGEPGVVLVIIEAIDNGR